MRQDVSIIIVSYNTKDFLKECLESLFLKVQDVSFEVIVVDNTSSDGSIEMVKQEFPKTTLIINKENLGFSKANNIGVTKASGKYLLFLNSDTVIQKETLKRMFDFLQTHERVGAATCFVELFSGKIDDASHRGFPTPWRAFCYFSGLSNIFPKSLFFNGYHLGWQHMNKTHEIDALAGAFMFVRRSAGEEVGWWDEDYFFYGEDIDFCYKLKEKGWKIYFVPEVKILHHKGITGGIKKHSAHISTADGKTKIRATNARFDAMKIFYNKHYTKIYPKWLTWVVLQGIEFKRKITLSSS